MLRTALAAVAAVVAIGLAGAPVADARPCYGTGTTCSHDPSYKPGPEARKVAAHRVADPIAKRITDAINGALGKVKQRISRPDVAKPKPKPKPKPTN